MNESVQMEWLIENRVRLLKLSGHFTSEAFQSYDRDTCALMDRMSDPLFHVIIDVRTLQAYPPLSVCTGIRSVRHARMGWMISIGVTNNPLMRFFVSVIVGAARIRYKDFDKVEDAVAFLQEHDPGLPPMNLDSLSLHVSQQD